VARRALLIFAEKAHLELGRRSFPAAARPLLNLPAFASAFSPEIDVHLFDSAGEVDGAEPNVHPQVGSGFAERFENAIETLARLGYQEVVAVGRDCPSLDARDVEQAFAGLASRKLVVGPDHRGGCYLIGFHAADRALLHGVRWKRNTDCAELIRRGGTENVFLLSVKHDLDSWSDLRLFARSNEALAHLAKFILTLGSPAGRGVVEFLSIVAQRMRIRQQMPPPAFAA
jgi:2-phospho-L-lactate guanylyltransferase (CobY/MobA/RfbA family)